MKTNFARALLVLGATFILALAPLQAEASHCSTAAAAGKWAYTYTGTIFTRNGPLPLVITSKAANGYHFKTGQRTHYRRLITLDLGTIRSENTHHVASLK